MLGYPAGALHGKRILDLIQVAGDDSQFKRRDGSLLSVRILSYPWNRALYGRGSICVFHDLSEQSRLERLLRDAVRRRRELVKYCSNGIYETSREGELLSVNAGLVRLLGFASEHELRAVDVKDLYVNAQDRSDKIAQLERDGFLRNVVLTLRRKDGAIMRVLENAHAVSGDDGRIVYYEGILTPIADE
jgi:PAS domain S-box-containing protein